MAQHALERASALFQPSTAVVAVRRRCWGRGGSDVAPVDDEDDGVADGVVGCPHAAEGVLAAYVPDFEVYVVEGDGGDVLADGGDGGFWGVGRGGGGVEGFYGGEEGGFAGVVEAEEEDGVFCCFGDGGLVGFA